MKESCKVSVIIPVYNVEQFLCECVDSVLAQTYQNFEIILIDDGATDKSGEICDQYESKNQRITVIHQENGGLSAARNTGLKNAKGDYVYFLDSDDYIIPNALELLVQTIDQTKADVVYFDAEVFFSDCEPDPKVYRYERSKQYETTNGHAMLLQLLETDEYRTAVPLMLFKHSYLTEHNLCFMPGILHEDELFTFLVYYANGVFAHCREKLYYRRMRAASIMTASSMFRRYESMLKIYKALSVGYRKRDIHGLVVDMYMRRIVRSVMAKYKALEENQKLERKSEYRSFEQDVLRNRGYGDMKLKIKCSHGALNWYYRALNRIKR